MVKFKFLILIILLALVLGGCTNPLKPNVQKPGNGKLPDNKQTYNTQNEANNTVQSGSITEQLAKQGKIKKFYSPEELREFLENNDTSPSHGYTGLSRGLGMAKAIDEAMPTADLGVSYAENLSLESAGGGMDDFSKTNVQVGGVDEADIIKSNGEYIYALVKNDLYIVKAFPADQAEVVAKIAFKSRPQDIYINDNYLAIYGRDNEIYKAEPYQKFKRRGQYTFLKIFDISNPKEPKLTRDLDFEGDYNNSRMIGDYLYFVTSDYNYYYIDDEPILPRILDHGDEIMKVCASKAADCVIPDIYYFDIPYNSYNFTTVVGINLKNPNAELKREVYLMSGSQNMYVSLNNIYITYTKYISEYQIEMAVMKELVLPRLKPKDQAKIARIEAVENYILNQNEKQNKISAILQRWAGSLTADGQKSLEKELEAAVKNKYEDISKELEKTVIHKIAIRDGSLEYQTNGEVTGYVLNQFSMDERGGYFRITTTKNRDWLRYNKETRQSYSNVFVLDKDLKVVGELTGLAKGEKIYSARFMQNRVYLVTFKQVDPLFVISLKDPTNPKVLGELEIPGFSEYLHPYDNDTLIGIGKDTGKSEWGGMRTKGLKLSLFDVSDVANPKEIDTYVMGDSGSDSIALHDHKAFLFSHDKNLLAIPVSIREDLGQRGWGKLSFSGAAVFDVDKDGFKLKGKIDHSDGGRAANQDYWGGYNYYDNTVKRCLYIGDVLYTFSNQYLEMNDLSDNLSLIKKLKLEKSRGAGDDFEIIN